MIKEKTLILATEDRGIFDKSERMTLEQALDLRNVRSPRQIQSGAKEGEQFYRGCRWCRF